MSQVTPALLTAQHFLQLSPDEGDITSELVMGDVVPKVSPKFFHAKLTHAFLRLFDSWSVGRGEICPAWAVILQRQGQDWVPVPDLLYVSYDRLSSNWSEDEACPVPPELIIEIMSPGQTLSQLTPKAQAYLDAGILRVWIVDSQLKIMTVFSPNASPKTYKVGDLIQDTVFPNFSLSLEELFQQAGI